MCIEKRLCTGQKFLAATLIMGTVLLNSFSQCELMACRASSFYHQSITLWNIDLVATE